MATPVVMPQMGESIAEGTIVRWIKKVGDQVDRDEPLFEISTDKVDAEIPSPAAGVLTAIQVKEGETVPVNSVVATIGAAGEIAGATGASGATGATSATGANGAKSERADATGTPGAAVAAPAPPEPKQSPVSRVAPVASVAPVAPVALVAPVAPVALVAPVAPVAAMSAAELRQKSSPLVRKIAKEHNVDISHIHGTGIGGRVTKHDILGYIDNGGSKHAPGPSAAAPVAAKPSIEQPHAPQPVTRLAHDEV